MSHSHDVEVESYQKTIFGFWVYLLTDFVFFAVYFAVYAVLHNNTFGGITSAEAFSLPYTLVQSIFLLLASFFAGLGGAAVHRGNKNASCWLFVITFLFGLIFFAMQYSEFAGLVSSGNSWTRSAFLSSYFNLVGILLIHVLIALIWTIFFLIQTGMEGLSARMVKRLTCLRMFWQFINIIWVFIFTIVYLLGAN
ncbi:MAG: cytochrome o ubiquinol oxidase subunit III [Simkaniaceae bacterium]|nr:cytochrome o ubiquinol oxidase subunit III [Simkaniaceae bacterium]